MTEIEVLSPGIQSTVQDLGRPGYGHLGVSACGAADPFALRIGNRLLGNPDRDAVLELTLAGGRFLFRRRTWFVLTGAELGATLDGRTIPLGTPALAGPGETLAFAGARIGARCYLCVRGGIQVPEVLGSRSTHLPSLLGGLEGRALAKGDRLCVGDPRTSFTPRQIAPDALASFRPGRDSLRITASAHSATIPESSREALLAESWLVQSDSSRMGVRLSGPPLAAPLGGSMITEGAPLGAIQVTPSGEPVILGVDHQTTGGYPKIGCVISADRWRIGQLRPRETVRFEMVSLDDARRLLLAQEELLQRELPCL